MYFREVIQGLEEHAEGDHPQGSTTVRGRAQGRTGSRAARAENGATLGLDE